MERTRLLIFHPALAPYRIDLFNRLADDFNLLIVFLEEDVSYQSFDQASLQSRLKAKHTFLQQSRSILGRQIPKGIREILDDFRPDVVVTHEFSPTSLVIAMRKGRYRYAHVIWTTDNPMAIRQEVRLRSSMRKILLRYVDALIVYADETGDIYRGRFGFDRPIGTCANVQSENALSAAFEESRPVARKMLAEYELHDKKVILMVGRLAKAKRQDRLIKGFAAAQKECRDLVLVLVGDGPERAEYEQLVRDLRIEDLVLFTGHIEGKELYAWFTIASLFVLTSEFEPWGAVVNEALVAGLPVICSDQAGARVLIEDGRNGIVIDAEDTQRIAAEVINWTAGMPSISYDLLARDRNSLMGNGFDMAVRGFAETIESVRRPR